MERFFYRNRNKGIPNLMLWLVCTNAAVYLLTMADPSGQLARFLAFDRALILKGEIWRLITFIFLEYHGSSLLWVALIAFVDYQIGRALENAWGTCRFNFFYLTGWLMSVLCGFILGSVNIFYVSLSLFLAYATLYPDAEFRLFFIIPIKARWLGLVDLALFAIMLLQIRSFPLNLYPLFALANYFLYFGKDFVHIFPVSWQVNASRLFKRKKKNQGPKTIPFHPTGAYASDKARPQAPYTHKCTVCGRTDVSDPGLEFRYCSKCKGYHCYCIEHINSHSHIEE